MGRQRRSIRLANKKPSIKKRDPPRDRKRISWKDSPYSSPKDPYRGCTPQQRRKVRISNKIDRNNLSNEYQKFAIDFFNMKTQQQGYHISRGQHFSSENMTELYNYVKDINAPAIGIDFTNGESTPHQKRFMKTIFKGSPSTTKKFKSLHPILKSILIALECAYEAPAAMDVLLLESKAGDQQQPLHADNNTESAELEELIKEGIKRPRLTIDKTFSILIGLEASYQSKTYWVDSSNKRNVIGQGRYAMWKGDYYHAGASYEVANHRLFISIGPLNKSEVQKDFDEDRVRVSVE